MAKCEFAIGYKSGEYRPCYVDGKKALFHRWADGEKPYIKINGFCSAKQLKKIKDELEKEAGILFTDNTQEINTIKETFAIVEYEDGTIAEVAPPRIKFADYTFSEYAFTPINE